MDDYEYIRSLAEMPPRPCDGVFSTGDRRAHLRMDDGYRHPLATDNPTVMLEGVTPPQTRSFYFARST